jgi:hypothetical protein
MDQAEEETFRRLTIGDNGLIAAMSTSGSATTVHRLDPGVEALLQLGALIAVDAPASSYRAVVDAALRGGARISDLLGVLVAVAETVGSARVVSAAPRIAMAAGYDVEAALERVDPARR